MVVPLLIRSLVGLLVAVGVLVTATPATAADPDCRHVWLPDVSSETGISLQLVCDVHDGGGGDGDGDRRSSTSARVGNTLVPRDQVLVVRSGNVKVTVSCLERKDRCTGRVRIVEGKVPFGTARYDLPPYPGTSDAPSERAVVVRLSRASRSLLRRSKAKTHMVTVALRRSDGKSGTGSLSLRRSPAA
jgi:hypothetical protein